MAATRLLALGLALFGGVSAALPPLETFDFPEIHAFKSNVSAPAFSFTNHTVIYAPVNNQTLGYPRVTELSDGSILIACTLSGYWPAFFPIFKSVDGGVTWNWLSNVGVGGNSTLRFPVAKKLGARQEDCDPDEDDDCDGDGDGDPGDDDPGDDPGDDKPIGLGAQPSLLQLTQAIGSFPAGTILAAGNRMGMDSTNLDLYASKDAGKSWQFVSTMAQGGPPSTGNGGSSIWEPFLMEYKKQVIVYYSDSRDETYAQKLSHQTSTDLLTWRDAVNDVAYPDYRDRPGMSVVAYIPPLKKYILVFEHGNGTRSKGGNSYPDSYKLATDPLLFEAAPPLSIEAKDYNGTVIGTMEPGSAPYVVWSPVGGANGTIVITDGNHKKLFINKMGGAESGWETRDVPEPHAYARSLHVLGKYPDHLMVIGAGPYRNRPAMKIPLSASVLNLTALVA